jgi:transcription elongation factor GreA
VSLTCCFENASGRLPVSWHEVDILSDECVIGIGSRVRVQFADGEDEFALVWPEDEDATEHMTTDSPLGRALIGRRVGERVLFRAPGGLMGVTVLDVS